MQTGGGHVDRQGTCRPSGPSRDMYYCDEILLVRARVLVGAVIALVHSKGRVWWVLLGPFLAFLYT